MGQLIPSVNIGPAGEHGDLHVMVEPAVSWYSTQSLTDLLETELSDYDYEAGDSIVALGDPAIIAVAFAHLGRRHGKFNLLKWERSIGRYVKTSINVIGEEESCQ